MFSVELSKVENRRWEEQRKTKIFALQNGQLSKIMQLSNISRKYEQDDVHLLCLKF